MITFYNYLFESYKNKDYTKFIEQADNELDRQYFQALQNDDIKKLNSLVINQVREKFKGTVIVNPSGSPRVMYHGSSWDPLSEPIGKAVFNKNYDRTMKYDEKRSSWGLYDFDFYFSASKNGLASTYGITYGYYLLVKNPQYIDTDASYEIDNFNDIGIEDSKSRRVMTKRNKQLYDEIMAKIADNSVFPSHMPPNLKKSGSSVKEADGIIGRAIFGGEDRSRTEYKQLSDEKNSLLQRQQELLDAKNKRFQIDDEIKQYYNSLSNDEKLEIHVEFGKDQYGGSDEKIRRIIKNRINNNYFITSHLQNLNFKKIIAKRMGEKIFDEFIKINDEGFWDSWGSELKKIEDRLKRLQFELKIASGKHLKEYDVVVLKDPNIIKIAKNVTYFDNGDPIPLSKRFDFSNPDVRF